MADDPRKRGADRKRLSRQPHEQSYQRKRNSQSASARGTRGNTSGRSGTEGGTSRGGESKR